MSTSSKATETFSQEATNVPTMESVPAGYGYLWLLADNGVVYKVNLYSKTIVLSFSLGGLQFYNGIEWDGSNIWLLGGNNSGFYLQKYNPTGNLLYTIPIPYIKNGYDLAWSDYAFYINDHNNSDPIFRQVYPTGAPGSIFDDPTPSTYDIAVGENFLWLASNSEDRIYKVTTYGSPQGYFSTGLVSTTRGGLAYGDNALWLAKYPEGTIFKFDTSGNFLQSFVGPTNILGASYEEEVCTCGSWQPGGCGGGSCGPSERQKTRSCFPSGCRPEYDCVADSSCGIVACNADAECGSDRFINTPYCSANNIYQEYRKYTCNNSGTTSSFYSSVDTPQLMESCGYLQCENGQCIDQCQDGIRDGDESDIDCGGSCNKCIDGKVCFTQHDCESDFCNGQNTCGCIDNDGDSFMDVICGGTDCNDNDVTTQKCPVLLVHGIGSSPAMWSEFPFDFSQQLKDSGYDVHVSDYSPGSDACDAMGNIIGYANILT